MVSANAGTDSLSTHGQRGMLYWGEGEGTARGCNKDKIEFTTGDPIKEIVPAMFGQKVVGVATPEDVDGFKFQEACKGASGVMKNEASLQS